MKSFFAFFSVMLALNSFSQSFNPYNIPLDSISGRITLKGNVDLPEISADSAFLKMQQWTTAVFTNPKDLIKTSNSKKRLILIKSFFQKNGHVKSLITDFYFDLKLQCTEKGYQYVFTNFAHSTEGTRKRVQTESALLFDNTTEQGKKLDAHRKEMYLFIRSSCDQVIARLTRFIKTK